MAEQIPNGPCFQPEWDLRARLCRILFFYCANDCLRSRIGGKHSPMRRLGAEHFGGFPIPDSGERVDGRTSVLIIDDDPTHLRIYGWIVDAAGYTAMPALVTADRIDFPDGPVDLVVMDYRLTGQITAVQAAQAIRQRFPEAPIIVLSDVYDLPMDIAPYAKAFVRKGEPAKLVATLARYAQGAARSDGAA